MPQTKATAASRQANYAMESTRKMAAFLDSIQQQQEDGADSRAVFDSVKNGTYETSPPEAVDRLMGMFPAGHEHRVLDSITAGISEYTERHGVAPTADLVEAAVQQGMSARRGINSDGRVLDDVTASSSSEHSANLSLQSNRAIVAIMSAIAEAIPFAGYLPVDIGSNQAKLAILSHVSGSTYGDYATGAIMDGTSVGDVFASSQRQALINAAGGTMPALPAAFAFTATNLTGASAGFCDPAGTAVPVLRGRTVVYVAGIPVTTEARTTSGSATLSGTVVLSGTSYTITGTINPDNGVGAISAITPALPAGTEMTVQAFVDLEKSPALIPSMIVRADTWDLFANPWRIKTNATIDSSTQLRQELGLDAQSEALMALRTQVAMERHYQALAYVKSLGANISATHDFRFTSEHDFKSRAQMWVDFSSTMGVVDQRMAEITMDHGVTHLYVGKFVAAQMMGLPADIFTPSGIVARPGVYRVGRLFGKYEVYYSPKRVTEAADGSTSQIVAVGRSSQPGRCPVILGDAVAPTFMPLALNADFVSQSGMYARDFTQVNPHVPSALGCALINLTNLK